MNMIAYYRVSTTKQGESGLGLEAQKAAVRQTFGEPVFAYTEIESGKNDNRPELAAAIEHAKEINGTLVIAKLDRLSRRLSFITKLMDSGVKFRCADMPSVDNFTIHILGAVAQRERELISQRTRAALKVKKEQGIELGNPNARAAILVNRQKRVYVKPDPEKIETLKMLRENGQHIAKIHSVAEQLFSRRLSRVTVYSYLKM
jgi:DNA invertase Pin-like site-specific DNA recombinase